MKKIERENLAQIRFGKDISKATIIRVLIGLTSFMIVTLLVFRGSIFLERLPRVGEIASRDIRAQISFKYEDKEATQSLRALRLKEIPDIYYRDPKIFKQVKEALDSLFLTVGKLQKMNISDDIRINRVVSKFPWIDKAVAVGLVNETDIEAIRGECVEIAEKLLEKGVIANNTKIMILSKGKDYVTIYDDEKKKLVRESIDAFLTDKDVDRELDSILKQKHPFDRSIRETLKALLLKLLTPNIIYDTAEISKRKKVVIEQTKPVMRAIKKGQMIVRRGDPITPHHIDILEAQWKTLKEYRKGSSIYRNLTGAILFVLIFFSIIALYLHYHQPQIFLCNLRLFLFSLLCLIGLGLTRIVMYFSSEVGHPFWTYFIVIPLTAMLIAILMDRELAIMSSVVLAFLASLMANKPFTNTLVVISASIVSIHSTTKLLHRWEFIRSGFYTGLAVAVAILTIQLLKFSPATQFLSEEIGFMLLGGVVSGILCAIGASILLPFLEKIFNITTDLQLLELSDLNHPLLKQLITKAPGTYHHSMVVSNMAEGACSTIGANALLAKVGSYFHDIGKISKPEYFIENVWYLDRTRHEDLQPTMSNLVILAHVKEGLKYAQKYKLPKVIQDIIQSHHGTSLVYYFYRQAQQKQVAESEVKEEDFRYPGPKPKTKEAGVILLADSVEAASRAITKPTPVRIKELVDKIVLEKLTDGQLDECPLTIRDISIIKDRFVHILTGILHTRIDYNKEDEKKEEAKP